MGEIMKVECKWPEFGLPLCKWGDPLEFQRGRRESTADRALSQDQEKEIMLGIWAGVFESVGV